MAKPMHVLVIGNPISGGGRARGACAALARALEGRGHEVEVFLTGAAGDGGRRAEDLGGVEALVVVGGDGTLNEVVNGLEDPAQVPFTQLPMGTANIFARELGLPFDPEGLAEVVHRGEVKRIDLGQIGDKRFLLVVSAGFDAEVTAELKRSRKGSLGFLGYARPLFEVVRGYRPPKLRVAVDGKGGYRGAWVVVTNTKNYGGLFTLAESASMDSGVLDVLVFENAGPLDFLRYAATGALGGGMSRRSGVTLVQGRQVRIEAEEPTDVEVDGDHYGLTPVEMAVVPQAARVFVPSAGGAP